MHIVAVLDDAPFDRGKRRRPLAHLFESLRNVRVGDIHRGHFDREALVIPKLEFREDFEDGAELQRLALGKIELLNLRLRNGCPLLFRDGFFDALWYERLQHFALDIFRESPANQRDRRFARPESWHACDTRKFLGHALNFFRYFFRGNLQIQLAAARCFSHGTILSQINDPAKNGSS